MQPMPIKIKFALAAWFIASVSEAGIAFALMHSQLLTTFHSVVLLPLLCVNPLVLLYCLMRRRWAYGALVVLAPLSLLWWPLGKGPLSQLGGYSLLGVAGIIALRFGARALTRDKTSEAWITSDTCGATFWLARKPTIVLGLREKLMQLIAAVLLGPALVGYVSGWNRLPVLLCIGGSILLVALSLVFARKRDS
jgi:hypothetical protein